MVRRSVAGTLLSSCLITLLALSFPKKKFDRTLADSPVQKYYMVLTLQFFGLELFVGLIVNGTHDGCVDGVTAGSSISMYHIVLAICCFGLELFYQ